MARSPRRHRLGALTLAAAAALATTATLAAPATAATPSTVQVRLMSFNDFHGNLEPPAGSSGRVLMSDGTTVNAGGGAYLATHVKQLRSQVTNSVLLSAGDNIGASPLASALFHDEPTIDLLNYLGVKASAVGNHELDEGYTELARMQLGGCNPTDGCQFRPSFSGAKFPYLAANMTTTNGTPAALPFTVTFSGGVPIGVIGVPLQELPTVVSADAVKGLKFGDEVKAINTSANLLDKLGVKTIVVELHQGDSVESNAGPNDCKTIAGPAREISEQASPKVDVVFTGHSHQQYNCSVTDPAGNPRPFLQGASFGRIISVADLTIDTRTRDVVRSKTVAHNEVVTRDVTPDKAAQALVTEAVAKSATIANRTVGSISADITRTATPAGETPLGDLIADSQLAATSGTAGAQLALMNPGGVRTDLTFAGSPAGEGDGVVTYGEAFAVQPFANILQTLTYTGAQLDGVLEQQYQPQPDGTVRSVILQPSGSLAYTTSTSAPVGSRISGITVNGVAVNPAASYRVTVNNFLAGGGDGFTRLTAGTNLVGGAIDLDAFTQYLTANSPAAPPATNRITLVG